MTRLTMAGGALIRPHNSRRWDGHNSTEESIRGEMSEVVTPNKKIGVGVVLFKRETGRWGGHLKEKQVESE